MWCGRGVLARRWTPYRRLLPRSFLVVICPSGEAAKSAIASCDRVALCRPPSPGWVVPWVDWATAGEARELQPPAATMKRESALSFLPGSPESVRMELRESVHGSALFAGRRD